MPGMRSRIIVMGGLAALGIGLLVVTDVTTEWGRGVGLGLNSHQETGPGFGRSLVQLPEASGAQAFGELPKATGAPPSADVREPAPREADSSGEAGPVEDPYAG